jgi:hypothetical protein
MDKSTSRLGPFMKGPTLLLCGAAPASVVIRLTVGLHWSRRSRRSVSQILRRDPLLLVHESDMERIDRPSKLRKRFSTLV